jgi:hypothetical protein
MLPAHKVCTLFKLFFLHEAHTFQACHSLSMMHSYAVNIYLDICCSSKVPKLWVVSRVWQFLIIIAGRKKELPLPQFLQKD